jgi:pimeloyl-ACP methyl ester carboxylesterase
MPIVRVNNRQISYWEGKDEQQAGRETILFVHGAGGGQLTWSFQKSSFEKLFDPIIIELPGHGESGGEGEEEIGRYAEHVDAFMRVLNLPKTFLVGHSMGGAIVQTLALNHPEVIKGIVLAGTGVRLRVLPSILEGIMNNFEETVPTITRAAFSRTVPREFIERGIEQLMRCRPEVLYGDFLACDRFDIMNEVQNIDLPTLILCGSEDELTPVKYSQVLHTRIRGSRWEILPDAGHMVMMEAPDAFNEKIKAFILNPVFSKDI